MRQVGFGCRRQCVQVHLFRTFEKPFEPLISNVKTQWHAAHCGSHAVATADKIEHMERGQFLTAEALQNGTPKDKPTAELKLGELGFMGLMVPADLGGAGLGYSGTTIVIEEMARHCGGTALMLCAHNGLGIGHIMLAASDEQKQNRRLDEPPHRREHGVRSPTA